jgi:D-lactate dehydrogenase
MKIAAFETEPWEVEALGVLSGAHELTCAGEPLSAANAAAHAGAEVVTGFLRSQLSAAVLAKIPGLRLVATRSTGYDHIDLDWCRAHGVAVCNVPDYGDETVAEHTFALMLAVSRRIVDAAERTRRGDFATAGLQGFDLAGRTLGVIGAGRIGRRVIAIAKGFGMRVLAADPRPDRATAAALGFAYAPLEAVLEQADVLTVHVPGGAATRDLIGERELLRLKAGAILVNTARGGVVNGPALVRALLSGRLAGAGLDVLAEETLVRDESEIFRGDSFIAPERLHALLASETVLHMPNVVVTPHIAYDSREAVQRIVRTTIDNITAFAAGRPQNLVGAAA